ncbi:type III-B CRISPR-associated protein Cas10/Cmr2 [Tengunoibacter tsumagoiensis]|uniref:Type III-B CRISPR-associated protein Cas10/Cmr2 n=2 Tax=Tengunoibacter tsumagoiensis TaxID=2014871 RepID=A0A402A5Z2_9CHLR|nr:type III-B CRISPR-associated protein Cas10/Cmr2 [Tengunoibacter tsumagoiensis]
MSYLFLVTIGPVQPFIKSARRTRDLFVGSMLLSELSKAVALALIDPETHLIFPAPISENQLQPDTKLSVANKIIAIIGHEPQEMAKRARTALFERLYSIRNQVFDSLPAIDRPLADHQIETLLDFAWVATPFDEHNYAKTRSRLETLLSARKNTRYFVPFIHTTTSSKNPRYKSSIDGQLECVIPEKYYDRSKPAQLRARDLYQLYKAGPGEQLSGVDLVKRHAKFPGLPVILSTSHIATLPFLKRLNSITDSNSRDKLKNAWSDYIEKIDEQTPLTEKIKGAKHTILGDRDGALLFDERLLIDFTREQYTKAHQCLETFWKEVKEATHSSLRPGPYYAIIHADGDNMGQLINHMAEKGFAQHQELSQRLDAFAQGVGDIVTAYEGVPVYSGGDDVLAFVPLHTALPCAHALAVDFAQKMVFKESDVPRPTLSVGIAIVHHLSLLQDSLDAARDAETCAKNHPQKNALAITVRKRSGEPVTTVGSWSTIYPWLKVLIEHFQQQHIPQGAAYELREVYQSLFLPGETMSTDLMHVLQYEAYRILKRKIMLNQQMSKEAKAATLKDIVDRLRIELSPQTGPIILEETDIASLINELLVVQPIVEAVNMAYGQEEGKK